MALPNATEGKSLDETAFRKGYSQAQRAKDDGKVQNPDAKAAQRQPDCDKPNPTKADDYSCGAKYALQGTSLDDAICAEQSKRVPSLGVFFTNATDMLRKAGITIEPLEPAHPLSPEGFSYATTGSDSPVGFTVTFRSRADRATVAAASPDIKEHGALQRVATTIQNRNNHSIPTTTEDLKGLLQAEVKAGNIKQETANYLVNTVHTLRGEVTTGALPPIDTTHLEELISPQTLRFRIIQP